MSSLHISILSTLLILITADNRTSFFTKSNYDLWCQENTLSHSIFLYPDRIPLGIYRTSNIKSVSYQLINDDNNGLFQIKTRRLADFYFLILNITRPFDINREYQDVYTLRIQANIITTEDNQTEQTELRLHVADSNDNDGVFDMDIYEQNFTQTIELSQSLLRIHASDADEIQHAQILYESTSSFNDTFSLHPFTGELYLITRDYLQSSYEFDIYAYDRYRKRLVDNNMKTKTHVKLYFNQFNQTKFFFQTIDNQTIQCEELLTSYEIKFIERTSVNRLNIHQPILIIETKPRETVMQIFILNNSSSNTKNLFIEDNQIYLNQYPLEEYHLQLLICFNHHWQCQYVKHRLIPSTDMNFYEFHFQSMEKIVLDENLPVDSFITRIQLADQHLYSQPSLMINYKLINDEKDFRFYLHPKTGILRLAERLEYRNYTLDIQANIQLGNRRYSIETTIEIYVREMNKHRPIFRNNTPVEFFQLPYQFQAIDFDQNQETNSRVTYRLWNCFDSCPFHLDPDNGTLSVQRTLEDRIYHLQILAFDWGQPISLESSLSIQVDLSTRLHKRDLTRTRAYSRRWRKKTTMNLLTTTISTEQSFDTTTSQSNIDTVYLNVGFRENTTSYYLSEDASINTIIDHFNIEYDSFPLNIDIDKDNIFFYKINDTTMPFIIDQTDRSIRLIERIDREKQNKYIFEIELKLKSIYAMKLQENRLCSTKQSSQVNFQYTNRFYQKMLVIIYINDVNDNIPQCRDFHSRIHLNENQLQKNIFQIQANDPDLGENGTIIYSLFDHQSNFFIDPSTGQIDCIKPIDREDYSSIELHILTSDQGLHPQYQSICTTLHIIINDLNDNIPQFLSNNFTFHLFSDMPRYSIFGQISAIDFDTNDRLTYSLSPNPYVTINKHTGHLRLKHHLHRLIDQILNVTVDVSDGIHRNQTSIQIYVHTFIDAQEPILLPEPAFALIVNESIAVGTVISNIYRRFQLMPSTIDLIEIVYNDDQRKLPFSIDQQGHLRLTDSLIGLSKSSYWLSLRLTRFRAHPPHTYIHAHLSIRQENFFFPQCQDLYQTVRVYDYATQYPFVQIETKTLNKQSHIQYSLVNDEKIFAINKQTGFLHLLPSIHAQRRLKSDYLLTTNIFDLQSKLSVACYVKVQLIRRRQLIPQFISSTIYKADLPEIPLGSNRLRQRLFQIVALLNPQVYDRKLEIRYRFTDINHHFIINRQTGYIAAKQPLDPYTTYEFNVEAFTVAYRDEILPDGNENDDDEHSNRGKWRIISSRVSLPIQLRILPLLSLNQSILSNVDSTINIDLLRTTEVGSIILQLGLNNPMNDSQWFIITGHIRYTRYFHVDFQKGQLILIRPIEELINLTNIIDLGINVTKDWITMNTIKVIIRLVNNEIPTIKFAQTDYFSSVSKSIPIGVEIAHLTIENSADDCVYSIDNVERIKSKDLFRINPYTGSITVLNSLETSSNAKHLLTILYRCEQQSLIAHTKLHINILDEKNFVNQTTKIFRFTQENYLVIFQTSLIPNQKKSLMNLQLINDEGILQQPQAKIIEGDPLGLFSIDTITQSLILLDESLSRSYIYPIKLTILDTSQTESINTTITIFISNIGIHFPCPNYILNSPFLFTYQSLPLQSIDPLTGWKRYAYQSLIIRAFDPFTPLNGEASNQAECIINSPEPSSMTSSSSSSEYLDFLFETEFYSGSMNQSFGLSSYVYNDQQEPLQIQVKLPVHSFDVTYHFTQENFLQLDEYAGLMTLHSINQTLFQHYSFLIYAKYHSFITFTRLNLRIHSAFISSDKTKPPSIYEFQLYTPFVNNYTIGYLNKTDEDWLILNEQIQPMISIENSPGRLFVRNRTLLLTNGNFYDFLIQDRYLQISRVQILILTPTEPIFQCRLQRFNHSTHRTWIGFIEIINDNRTNSICDLKSRRSFTLLNYHDRLALDRQHGLLYYRNESDMIDEDLLLLIQIDRSRCLVNIDRTVSNVYYRMIRNDSQLQKELQAQYHLDQPSGQMQFVNGTVLKYGIIPSRSPIFSANAYQFSVNLTNITTNQPIYLGQILAEPYDIHHSHLVYEFIDQPKHFLLNIDTGILEYVPNVDYNQTIEQFQVTARDLIYQQTTTVNLTIEIIQPTIMTLSKLIYDVTVSEILPPGSMIFQTNRSANRYSLRDYNQHFFEINSLTGRVTLRNYLHDRFYSLKIHLTPSNEILIIRLTVIDYNNHSPRFLNLPLNLSLSSSDIFITKLSAYDFDLIDNQKLRYYLLDYHDEQFFSINSSTGILTLKNHSFSKSSFQLNLGVSDGLYLTRNYLQLHFFNYSKHSPSFSSNEYLFQYDPTREILGQISAYDSDVNDRIFYQLYLQPNDIHIDSSTGVIRVKKGFFSKPVVEFIASAMDLAQQIVYTKIKIVYLIQPKFSSNLYFVNLMRKDLIIPSEIFQFELVDLFNQPLQSAKFQLKNQTNFFEILDDKLLIKENPPYSTDYLLNINAYWKNFILQTAVRIQFVENLVQLEKKFYQFSIEKSSLKENFLLGEFPSNHFILQIRSTPLTRNDCHENFDIQHEKFFFKTFPILSDLCFFQLHVTDNISSSISQIQISFVHSNLPPKFSSNIYRFQLDDRRQNSFRVFANGSNPVRYQLEKNFEGFFINQTDGIITYRHDLHGKENLQLTVYAIDEKTNVNDTALIEITFNGKTSWQMPSNDSTIPSCPNRPMSLSDQSLPGTVIQDISRQYENISSIYYILEGDDYGLFAINHFGQLYLTSTILNQTSEENFQLIILISSLSSISYCRTNVSIQRTPRWMYFICPAMPIEWMIQEELPLGTSIGTIRETLTLINNFTQLLDQLSFKLNHPNNDAQSFLLNSQTGLITSNARLDYEQKSIYSFSISLEPMELNCSISIRIKLININDNPIVFNITSLRYNITENNPVPFYIGRVQLIDIDRLFLSNYEFYLRNFSEQISVDSSTGSIILYHQLDREYHGAELNYEIFAIDRVNQGNNLTNILTFSLHDINDHGPKFTRDFYSINISKSLRVGSAIFQMNATSDDPFVNGRMIYSLRNSSEYFLIESQTGIIRLKQSLPSMLNNITLSIEVVESEVNLTNQTNLFISIVNDDQNYFDFNERNRCFLEENQHIGSIICTIGKNSNAFIYELLNQQEDFQILENNGTIINRKVFDYETDSHQYHLTILVRDRENQSASLSSLNVTIYLRNINDNPSEFLTKNSTTIIYFYYPSIQTVLHRIEVFDADQSALNLQILNNSFYSLHSLNNNTFELILIQPILIDRQDHLIIRLLNNQTLDSSDLHLHFIYLQPTISDVKIFPQTIDGYVNFDENISTINFGQLTVENQSKYSFIHYELVSMNQPFTLKQISNNQTELYFHRNTSFSHQHKHRLLQFHIELTVIAINQSIQGIDFNQQPILRLPQTPKSQSIDIHLWSIDHEMLDRTLSLLINLNSQSTYEQFVIQSLPSIREHLAEIVGVNLRHVHVYTFEQKSSHQIELLLAIIRYPSRLRPPRYIHKKLLYNALKNSTNFLEKILHIQSIAKISINQCQPKSCENNGRCTSRIKLHSNQYNYFSYNSYTRLIPRYQWNIKCLCLNHFYGQYCQFKQEYQSPCSSNPCSAVERCIDESATLYSCQCIDEPCQLNEISLDCININSPTCRDVSNTLTFDGYSFVRMNSTMNLTKHFNLTFTFRTQVGQGKFLSLYDQTKTYSLFIQINNGYMSIQLNEKILFQINDIQVQDGLWHHIFFSMDYIVNSNQYYYLLRLDHVFSSTIISSQPRFSHQLNEVLIGNDFHGCLGNLTLNNRIISLRKQDANVYFLEHIGTNDGCQLAEIETRTLRQYKGKEDLCSLYNPCYHGGKCLSTNGISFTCDCLKPRFVGRQCQRDLEPCRSHPCLFDEQCVPSSNQYNVTYSCLSSLVSLPMSTKNPLYIGLAVTICTFILFVLLILSLIIYCQQQRKERKRKIHLKHEKPSVSAPLLLQKSPPLSGTNINNNSNNNNNTIESPIQTLLKVNSNGKPTVETMALVDNIPITTMNNFNDKQSNGQLNKSSLSIDKPSQHHKRSQESLNHRRSDPKYYSSIGKMNIPPDNFLMHYNGGDYDTSCIPLVDPQSNDLFDFPSSPTKYFNGHKDQIGINSLSNFTEKLADQNDLELTHSSNDSSNNEQTLLTSPISNGDRKRSIFNGGSSQSIRASSSSLHKAPVYAKVIKTASSKVTNGGMSTIERLRLSGSPLRLLSSSPTYVRTTSFFKGNNADPMQTSTSSSTTKNSKITPTSWKLNPRKLDSLKARRHSRQTDDEDDHETNNETSQLTINRLRHSSESDLTKGSLNGKKSTKLSSFFQTEV